MSSTHGNTAGQPLPASRRVDPAYIRALAKEAARMLERTTGLLEEVHQGLSPEDLADVLRTTLNVTREAWDTVATIVEELTS